MSGSRRLWGFFRSHTAIQQLAQSLSPGVCDSESPCPQQPSHAVHLTSATSTSSAVPSPWQTPAMERNPKLSLLGLLTANHPDLDRLWVHRFVGEKNPQAWNQPREFKEILTSHRYIFSLILYPQAFRDGWHILASLP